MSRLPVHPDPNSSTLQLRHVLQTRFPLKAQGAASNCPASQVAQAVHARFARAVQGVDSYVPLPHDAVHARQNRSCEGVHVAASYFPVTHVEHSLHCVLAFPIHPPAHVYPGLHTAQAVQRRFVLTVHAWYSYWLLEQTVQDWQRVFAADVHADSMYEPVPHVEQA